MTTCENCGEIDEFIDITVWIDGYVNDDFSNLGNVPIGIEFADTGDVQDVCNERCLCCKAILSKYHIHNGYGLCHACNSKYWQIPYLIADAEFRFKKKKREATKARHAIQYRRFKTYHSV